MKLMFCPSLVHNEKMFPGAMILEKVMKIISGVQMDRNSQCVPASVRMESKLAPMNYMLGP